MSGPTFPDGWRWTQFGDVVRQVNETTKDPEAAGFARTVGLEHLDPHSLSLERWNEISELPDGTSFTRIFRAGQVLFGKRRAYQRKVAVANFDGICSGDILVLEPSTKAVLPEFLPYLVQSDGFFAHALGTSAGSLSPRTKWQDLAKYEFALPPISVQADVVATLELARSTVGLSRDVHHKSALLRDAMIEEAVWDRAKGDWSVSLVPVRDLLTEPARNGVSPPSSSAARGKLRSVSISAVNNGRFTADISTEKWCESIQNPAQFEVLRGDVFAIRGNGNRSLVGRVGVVIETPNPPCIYPDLLIRLRFDGSKIDPVLAAAIWNSRRVHARLLDRAKSSNGIYKVNGQDISRHLLPVPPFTERRALARRLRTIDGTIDSAVDHTAAAATLLTRLRESLLRGGSYV